MGIKLNIDFDDWEKWLTPERVEIALYNGGFDIELKDEEKRKEEGSNIEEKNEN